MSRQNTGICGVGTAARTGRFNTTVTSGELVRLVMLSSSNHTSNLILCIFIFKAATSTMQTLSHEHFVCIYFLFPKTPPPPTANEVNNFLNVRVDLYETQDFITSRNIFTFTFFLTFIKKRSNSHSSYNI
jgi:hypothetical protein